MGMGMEMGFSMIINTRIRHHSYCLYYSDGSCNDSGYGDGFGSGYGYGFGSGKGYGDGYGDGNGYA